MNFVLFYYVFDIESVVIILLSYLLVEDDEEEELNGLLGDEFKHWK